MTSAGERPWRPSHETKSFILTSCFTGWLLDNNSHRCESLTDLSYPVVLLEGRKSGSDGLIEGLRIDLCGVLDTLDIGHRHFARSKNHAMKATIFVFCSPQGSLSTVSRLLSFLAQDSQRANQMNELGILQPYVLSILIGWVA